MVIHPVETFGIARKVEDEDGDQEPALLQ